jgi:iron complex transport system substrate-binding protein
MRTHVISLRLLSAFSLFVLLSLAACGSQTSTSSVTSSSTLTPKVVAPITDFYGTAVAVPKTAPQRIVSLTASTSEILAALNLQDKIVGVDTFTDYPASLTSVKKISDAMGNYNVEQIVALKPDLVVSDNGLTKSVDGQLSKLGIVVADLPGANLDQAEAQILSLGELTRTQATAQKVVGQMKEQISSTEKLVQGTAAPKVLLEVDYSTPGKPYVFGGNSFGDDLLQDAAANNIFHSNTENGGFPQVADEAVIAANPQYIILTEDPKYGGDPNLVYKRNAWKGIAAVAAHHVYHINTELLQRPTPRLAEGLRCIAQIVHPDKFSGPLPSYCS